jgi:hypothetical protein
MTLTGKTFAYTTKIPFNRNLDLKAMPCASPDDITKGI